jgi:hypothetical protein
MSIGGSNAILPETPEYRTAIYVRSSAVAGHTSEQSPREKRTTQSAMLVEDDLSRKRGRFSQTFLANLAF